MQLLSCKYKVAGWLLVRCRTALNLLSCNFTWGGWCALTLYCLFSDVVLGGGMLEKIVTCNLTNINSPDELFKV